MVTDGLEVDESLLTGESETVRQAPGDGVLSGSFVAAGTGRSRATDVGARRVRGAPCRGRSPIQPHAIGAPNRDRPDPSIRDVGDRADRDVAVRESVARTWVVAGGDVRRRGRHRCDGAGRARLADLARVLGRRGAPRQTARARAGAGGRRGPRARGRPVHRQDRHAHRGSTRASIASSGSTRISTAGPALAALAAADPAPNATLQAIAQGLSAATAGWSVERTVPFSSARKWGAAAFAGHGAWVLGAPDILTS